MKEFIWKLILSFVQSLGDRTSVRIEFWGGKQSSVGAEMLRSNSPYASRREINFSAIYCCSDFTSTPFLAFGTPGKPFGRRDGGTPELVVSAAGSGSDIGELFPLRNSTWVKNQVPTAVMQNLLSVALVLVPQSERWRFECATIECWIPVRDLKLFVPCCGAPVYSGEESSPDNLTPVEGARFLRNCKCGSACIWEPQVPELPLHVQVYDNNIPYEG